MSAAADFLRAAFAKSLNSSMILAVLGARFPARGATSTMPATGLPADAADAEATAAAGAGATPYGGFGSRPWWA